MSYRIKSNETVNKGLHRIIDEQVTKAIHSLIKTNNVHEGVHNARRSLKITRATLRLIRKDIGERKFKIKNNILRDEARKLSKLRDMTAMIETLQFLEIASGGKLETEVLVRLKSALDLKRKQIYKGNDKESTLILEVADSLLDVRKRVNKFKLSANYLFNILRSIQKVYKRGYLALQANYHYPEPEKIHEWRKRAKYLRYHFHILEEVWPAITKPMEKELHRLTDLLGNYQNLTVLIDYLIESDSILRADQQGRLLAIAFENQRKLHLRAQMLGQKIYSETPKAFIKRLQQHPKKSVKNFQSVVVIG